MYDRFRGELLDLSPTEAVVDVGGVGYVLAIPLSTYDRLKGQRDALLFAHLHVREDELRLFGFADRDERQLFRMVLSVTGVGPSIGLACLSALTPGDVVGALASGDVATLQRVKGVGRRVAERMVVDLKDRAAALAGVFDGGRGPVAEATSSGERAEPASGEALAREDALQALIELGYQRKAAEQRVDKAAEQLRGRGEAIVLESLIRVCLRG